MDNMMKRKRDGRLDCIKGIAISLVVIGHILQFCYDHYSSTLVFNIIWTLQIPLFMVVSGFFVGGGITITQIAKRFRYYLIPFCTCWLISEFFIRGNTNLLERAGYLVYHLESSLWYLFVLFELSCVHMIAVTIASKICKTEIAAMKRFAVYTIVYGVCLMPFAGLAVIMGASFLGSKFVLYYSVFFWMGSAWKTTINTVRNESEHKKFQIAKILNGVTVVAFVIYFGILSHFNIAEAGDGLVDIIIRFTASACGVFLIVKMVFSVYKENNPCCKFLTFLGKYTLEIYYIHYLFIPYFAGSVYPLATPAGMISLIFLYFAVLSICALGVMLAKSSPYLSLVLFGRGIQ